ncbi:hypothetical protein HOF92_08705 [bacterium]|mgnify:CR=1 FL=1|jgi:hypothetical protein|nr:hypothetical protein [bacterium]
MKKGLDYFSLCYAAYISDLLQSSIHSLEPVTFGCSSASAYSIKGDQTSYLKIVGFIDLSRAGVSDRYQALALAWRSIRYNFGAGFDDLLFEEYGVERDFLFSIFL